MDCCREQRLLSGHAEPNLPSERTCHATPIQHTMSALCKERQQPSLPAIQTSLMLIQKSMIAGKCDVEGSLSLARKP
ncbi:hypothetical protein WJX74_001446 [Apatococcus lobatus]|uniref:Uncharacterized protein n=1 Tax=Apatococcus lobatus TaxID=904363 RepID=A0AAW1S5S1_9CHLO